MTKFLAAIFVVVCFLGLSAQAQTMNAKEKKSVQESVANAMPVSKREIESSIDNLVKQGLITAEQAAQARKELQGMSEEDLQKIKKQAAEAMSR